MQNDPPPELSADEIERDTFYLKTPLNVSGVHLRRGDVVVTVERPRGVGVHDALQTIFTGQAVNHRIF